MTQRDRQLRLCHLVAAMMLEETYKKARTVPSSYTLLKAEFGFTGSRSHVLEVATQVAKGGKYVRVVDPVSVS